MTWIKICGTTNLEDALTAVEAGANALGFVFYEKSPRNIQVETAREIVKHLPAGVEKVGVFVNEGEDSISRIADEVGLTATQFHGDHEDARVADLVAGRRPPLKVFVAISMSRRDPRERAIMWNPKVVHAFLLDSGISSRHGGTGESFDWSASIPTVETIRSLGNVLVAGGLTPENVGEAIGILKPWGVDVVSGVEARPGKKDPEKVRAFLNAVRAADNSAQK